MNTEPRKQREDFIAELPGTFPCPHRINVRVRQFTHDQVAVQAAKTTGNDFTLLDRMCPYCHTRRVFKLKLSLLAEPQIDYWSNSAVMAYPVYTPLQLSDPLARPESPKSIARRFFFEAVEFHKKRELKKAEEKYRECISLCELLELVGEKLTAQDHLNILLEEVNK